jgi:hypothetical protein
MTTPPLLNDILQLLIGAAVPAAICALLLAGIALRQEGGVNFEAGGKFQRWILWSAIFLTLPGILAWFGSRGVSVPALNNAGITSSWLGSIAGTFEAFVSQIVVGRLVPITASFFVLKAALDAAHGHTPIGSVVAAIFLLSIPGTIQLLESWNTGSVFATTDLLSSLWNYLAGTILPEAAGLAVVGAIINFVRHKPVGQMVAAALAFLSVSALWKLLQVMVSS